MLVDVELGRGVADEALQHGVKLVAPAFAVPLGEIDADQREFLRQHAGAREIVERRHHQALGQVAAGAEDHHGARIGRRQRPPRRRFDDLRRRRRRRCIVRHDHLLRGVGRAYNSRFGAGSPISLSTARGPHIGEWNCGASDRAMRILIWGREEMFCAGASRGLDRSARRGPAARRANPPSSPRGSEATKRSRLGRTQPPVWIASSLTLPCHDGSVD